MRSLVKIKKQILGFNTADTYFLLLSLIILTAPIIIYGFSIHGISLRLSRVFTILILPFLFLKIKSNLNLILRDKFFIFGILPFSIFSTLSILWTPQASFSFGLNRLAALAEVMLVYLLLIMADLNGQKFQSIVKTYLASALIPMAIGIWQSVNNLIHFSVPEVPFNSFLIPGKYEEFRDRFFTAEGGLTRITSCFAEPTIFGTFMSSVLLLSLLVEPKTKLSNFAFRIFQVLVLYCLLISLSKLAILTFAVGIIIIFRKKIKYLLGLGLGLSLFFGISYVIFKQHLHMEFVTRRFFTSSGHLTLFLTSMAQLTNLKGFHLFAGNGIGSIPEFSTNKFLLSRIYEGGLLGLLFAFYVSVVPFQILFLKTKNLKLDKIKNISFAVIFSVIIGFHLYDDFIYIWPWIVIGSIMSFYCHTKHSSEVDNN